MTTDNPRGVRLNNPGNIRHSDDKWQGKSKEQPDRLFLKFDAPKWGIRAMARVLIRYQDHYNLNNVEAIINRWAPPSENATQSYIKHVYKLTKFESGQLLDMHKYEDIAPLIKAIITHENGFNPYDDTTINLGIMLAGIEVPKKPLAKSTTIRAGKAATTALVAGETSAQLMDAHTALAPIADYSEWVRIAMVVIVLASVGLMIYSRVKDDDKRVA
jgi:hypothetical protein